MIFFDSRNHLMFLRGILITNRTFGLLYSGASFHICPRNRSPSNKLQAKLLTVQEDITGTFIFTSHISILFKYYYLSEEEKKCRCMCVCAYLYIYTQQISVICPIYLITYLSIGNINSSICPSIWCFHYTSTSLSPLHLFF